MWTARAPGHRRSAEYSLCTCDDDDDDDDDVDVDDDDDDDDDVDNNDDDDVDDNDDDATAAADDDDDEAYNDRGTPGHHRLCGQSGPLATEGQLSTACVHVIMGMMMMMM